MFQGTTLEDGPSLFSDLTSFSLLDCLPREVWHSVTVPVSLDVVQCLGRGSGENAHASARLPMDGSSWNLALGDFYEILSNNSKFDYNRTKKSSTLYEVLSTFTLLTAVRNIFCSSTAQREPHCCSSVISMDSNFLIFSFAPLNIVDLPRVPHLFHPHHDTWKLFLRAVKCKSFPLQAWCVSWGSRRLRLLDRLNIRHDGGGKVVTPTRRPSSPPGVFLVLIFRGWVDPRAHGSDGSLGKNPQRHHRGSISRRSD